MLLGEEVKIRLSDGLHRIAKSKYIGLRSIYSDKPAVDILESRFQD